MTTFVLKKYEDRSPVEGGVSDKETEGEKPAVKEEAMIEIKASDTISKIVATALYRALPNNVEIEERENSGTDNAVISTEDINRNPADCVNRLKNGSTVVIVGEGFKTAKEDWFLSTLENKNMKVFYSMESFISHVKKTLGV